MKGYRRRIIGIRKGVTNHSSFYQQHQARSYRESTGKRLKDKGSQSKWWRNQVQSSKNYCKDQTRASHQDATSVATWLQGRGKCNRQGVTYDIRCNTCGDQYVGETAKSTYTGGVEHKEALEKREWKNRPVETLRRETWKGNPDVQNVRNSCLWRWRNV